MLRMKRHGADFGYSNIKLFQANRDGSWSSYEGFHYVVIFSTNNRQTVFGECDGSGMRYGPRYPEPHFYENHCLLNFDMKAGKIERAREIFNPFNVLRPFGEDVPELFQTWAL